MRDLRAGDPVDGGAVDSADGGDGGVDEPAETAITEATGSSLLVSGPAPDEQSFLASLGRALAGLADDGRVVVFRARGHLVPLTGAAGAAVAPTEPERSGVEQRLLSVDPTIVTFRVDGEVIGFASEPCTPEEALGLGGALAASLGQVVGRPQAPAVISPRLGVAFVGRPDRGAGRLAAVAAEALDSVERTLANTTTDTPYLVHNDYIRSRSRRQHRIERDLPRALAERQLTLEFQPRVRLDDDRQAGLEVRACWVHPHLGSVASHDIVRAAERGGLLAGFNRRLRTDALALARRWASAGTLARRRLWFDLSPAELLSERFLDEVAELTAGLDEVTIGFELTDGDLLDDIVFARPLDTLDELGVALALDALQPSLPAFRRLNRLPVRQINLDAYLLRSGVGDAGVRELFGAACANAAARSVEVLVYRVDTDDQLELALDLGADLAQGLAVCDPVAEADVWPLLDRSS